MDKQRVVELRSKLENHLGKLNGDHLFTVGRAVYSDTDVTFKVNVRDANAQPKEKADFFAHADMFGLKPTDLNKIFVTGRGRYKIVGLRMSARRRPIIATEVGTGRQFVFPGEMVRNALGRNQ